MTYLRKEELRKINGRIMKHLLLIASLAFSLTAHATERDPAQRAEFMRQQPCPATGKTHGACPGWQVDHRDPLKCGGIDHPVNMQWLTVRDYKAKTKREAKWCRSK